MNVPSGIALVIAGCLVSTAARADHVDLVMRSGDRGSTFGAGIAGVAASFSNHYYTGNYQGVRASERWSMGRFGLGVDEGYYRLYRNGLENDGISDVIVHGQVALIMRPAVRAGVMASVSDPVGDGLVGIGMGHVMVGGGVEDKQAGSAGPTRRAPSDPTDGGRCANARET